jgi:hypothetical protein
MLTTGSSLSWTADQDYVFVGAGSIASAGGTQVITTDPSQTAAEASTPTSTRISYDILWANNNAGHGINLPVKIPVPKGTKLIVSCATSATNVLAYFETAESAEGDHVVLPS